MSGLFWALAGCPLADARIACEQAAYNERSKSHVTSVPCRAC